MKDLKFCLEISALISIVPTAALIAREKLAGDAEVRIKSDRPGGSHHALFTAADLASEEYLLRELRRAFPGTLILSEESAGDVQLLGGGTTTFILDPLDGTAGASRRRWDWSVCANFMRGGRHLGGVICALDVCGGLLVVGEKGQGACVQEGNSEIHLAARIPTQCPVATATVLYGVDVLKRPQFIRFTNQVANAVQTAVVAGSCALGVATVAAGKADALVQPQQWPWDWASAAIVEAAGGRVQYYHYRQGELVALDKPDPASYDIHNRTDHGGLGFIAGVPDLVEWLWQQLQDNWNK